MSSWVPELTLPSAEAAALRSAYEGAQVVLEYGSGGSTCLAVDMGIELWSVESDPAWRDRMQQWLDGQNPRAPVHLLHVDIGPTKEWGHPRDESSFRKWPDYPLSVWDAPGFNHPDVVLIDGRFRVACFLTTLFRITRPVTVLFDDYPPRPAYHKVEALAKPTEMIGRMARFDLQPTVLTPDRFRDYARYLLQPV